jgi:hypothetical protein
MRTQAQTTPEAAAGLSHTCDALVKHVWHACDTLLVQIDLTAHLGSCP